MMNEVAKGLPSYLRQLAEDVSWRGFPASTNLYSYNRVNSHLAGRAGQREAYVGSNEMNRGLLRTESRKKLSVANVHQENAKAYQKARAKRMAMRGIADIERRLSGGA